MTQEGLEEEYFHRKNQEALEKMRENEGRRGSEGRWNIFNELSQM